MSQIIQFRLSPIDTERAHEALDHSSARNLNMLSKQVFLDFLADRASQPKRLEYMALELQELRRTQQEMLDLMRAAGPETALSVMSAIFLLMYRSVTASTRAELDAAFNADAVITFLKNGG